MILLIGIPSETPLRLLAEACRSKHLPYTIFSQREQGYWHVGEDPAGEALLGNGQASFRLADCSGLYLRTMDQTRVPEYVAAEDTTSIDNMYQRLFCALDEERSCRVVNAPAVQMSNNSKPYQSLIIRQCGLDIPEMCITSCVDEAESFLARYPAAIYKSISGSRSIVKRVDADALRNLYKIKYCPVQFQEQVTGFNVRVHVVGERVIATRICSDAVDYRYAKTEGLSATLEPYFLTPELAYKCINLSKRLQLPFAGIDLMITGDGRTVCFEVNPSPGYSYYELSTGQPISQALADYLAGEAA